MSNLSNIPRIVVAGLRGGSGKTTLSIGLIAALGDRGLDVVPFKKGPDYIDAGWLAGAAGRSCYNLDPFLIGPDAVLSSFLSHSPAGRKGVSVIEGNRGLYDGMDVEGTYSTARLARILKAPVLLIVDCTKVTRTAAALVLGAKKFDPRVRLGGVILNRIAGARHEAIVRQSIERYTGVPVLGSIPKLAHAEFPERHMGLTPFQEHPEVQGAIAKTGEIIGRHVDIAAVLRLARSAEQLRLPKEILRDATLSPAAQVKIGVIRDSAFQFYYPENFEALSGAGAELIEISALTGETLPKVDALYIGGGFPETHAITLAKNTKFKKALYAAVQGGIPVYAECGGLMYLGETLTVGGKAHKMAGILPVSFVLNQRPEAHGYTIVKVTRANPFYKKGTVLRGHEFHYSKAVSFGAGGGAFMALGMKRGKGIREGMDGLCYKNVFATYTHIHALGAPEWTEGMIRAALRFKKSRA